MTFNRTRSVGETVENEESKHEGRETKTMNEQTSMLEIIFDHV